MHFQTHYVPCTSCISFNTTAVVRLSFKLLLKNQGGREFVRGVSASHPLNVTLCMFTVLYISQKGKPYHATLPSDRSAPYNICSLKVFYKQIQTVSGYVHHIGKS